MTNSEIRKIMLDRFEANESIINKRTDENIEKYRKGDCRIRITDESGKPFSGKKVKISQKTHDFKYGANIFMLDEFETDDENQKYRDLFYKYFNLATVPFYWEAIEPEEGKLRYGADSPKMFRRPAPDKCIKYCEDKGIMAKLHCLVYDTCTPKWAHDADEDTLMRLYEKRFSEIAARYSGKLYELEVINELLSAQWRPDQTTVLSEKRDILEWCFNLAEKYFPNDTLVLNDGNYLPEIGAKNKGYRHPYYMMIDAALAKGTPIGKIGLQNHIFCNVNDSKQWSLEGNSAFFNPELQIKGLNILSALGKPMEITEITIPTVGEGTEAEEFQAEVLKYLYTIWFSTPLLETAVYWNTVEGTAAAVPDWDENKCRGGLFRRDFSPKPAAIMLKKLFSEIWHTELEATTDAEGYIDFRGFYGDYEAICEDRTVKFGIHKNKFPHIMFQL